MFGELQVRRGEIKIFRIRNTSQGTEHFIALNDGPVSQRGFDMSQTVPLHLRHLTLPQKVSAIGFKTSDKTRRQLGIHETNGVRSTVDHGDLRSQYGKNRGIFTGDDAGAQDRERGRNVEH